MNIRSRRQFAVSLTSITTAGLFGGSLPVATTKAQSTSHEDFSQPGVFNVRDFGAKGDGTTKDTLAIQATIDACSTAGGGIVYLPPGVFLSGTITLKDNITLHLAHSAKLLGSTDRSDYPAKPFPARDLDIGGFDVWALVYAEGSKNFSIEGRGTIDGNGKDFPPLKKNPSLDIATGPRPRAIFLKDCSRFTLRDFHVHNSACWTVHLVRCDNAILDGLDIFSEHHIHQDGIVLDSSRVIRVVNCRINTRDDCIVFKSSLPEACESVVVSDCILSGNCSGIKFGTQSLGGFRNFAISNCVVDSCRLGGLKFETMDGGTLEDVTVSNIVMTDSTAPLFFRIGNRGQDFGFKEVQRPRPIGILRNIHISGIQATLSKRSDWITGSGQSWNTMAGCTMIIAGLPGHPIENVTLSNIQAIFPGGGTSADAKRNDIPELESRYPENDMFGVLPSWGFYMRHAKGITFDNVRLELSKPDQRPSIIADDVADLEISRLKASSSDSKSLIRIRHTRGVLIQNSRPLGMQDTFLSVEGDQSADIALVNNDLRFADHSFEKSDGFIGEIIESGKLSPKR